MQIAIFSKSLPHDGMVYLKEIFKHLESNHARISIYEPFYKTIRDQLTPGTEYKLFNDHHDIAHNADFLFSIGGDGTLLDTISIVRDSGIPILGINLGRMGFLSSISRDRIGQALEGLFKKTFKLDQRTLIRLQTEANLFGGMNYALNELCVYRKSPQSMLKIQVFVNEEYLNSYWADGLIVSTPTGSTAYSLSNGGPIILPSSRDFVITPIATHNLTVRPIVIPDDSKIRIKVVGRITEFHINLDSRSVLADSSVELNVSRDEFMINLVRLEKESYFQTIRDKLMWGLDIRN
ncbi:MAG: NAD kinase [Bacteroidales bacterium]